FRILLLAPEHNLQIQARIPVTMAALHNFILFHEPLDEPEAAFVDVAMGERHGDPLDPDHCASSEQAEGIERQARTLDDVIGDARQEQIATAMWEDYVLL
ncbi:hypothetical protein FIBSPDRAFT_758700, partial [Athelia psychrophila]